ncbi:MAG: hypothetical protein GYB21_07210 [Oceanospirillales bacterium]|nr:hypothetical protein [Oceanospirillales bacterium]
MSVPTDLGIQLIKQVLPMIIAVGVFAVGFEFLKLKIERRLREKRGELPEDRIKRLANNLREATSAISEIEAELKERHALAEKVKSDYERYQKLAGLKRDEVEAVVQALRGELREEGTKSLWKSAIINLVFFIAGVLVTVYMA